MGRGIVSQIFGIDEREKSVEISVAKAKEHVQKKKINPLILQLFEKPKYVAETSTSALTFPIHSMSAVKIEESEKLSIDKRIISYIGLTFLERGYPTQIRAIPGWKYRTPPTGPSIREVLDKITNYLHGETDATTIRSVSELTKYKNLDEQFRVADQLLDIVRYSTTIRATHLLNDADGVDILAEVESMTSPENKYNVLISIRGEENRPKIYVYCTCPIGSKGGLICKHAMTVLASRPHLILASLDYIASGRSKPFESYIEYWKERTQTLLKEMRDEYSRAGFIYYFTKFLLKRGYLTSIKLRPEDANLLRETTEYVLSGNDVERLESTGLVKVQITARPEKQYSVSASGTLLKIVWTPEMEEMRKKLIDVINELGERFGIVSDIGHGEWPTLLVYAMVMSADYTKPPIVIHAVGDIGTFKTSGARLISEYLKIPEYTLSYTGTDVVEKYRAFLQVLSENFNIPMSEIENKVGGVITQLRTSRDKLVIGLSLPMLFSRIKDQSDGLKKLNTFLQTVKNMGFEITSRFSRPKVTILDPAQLSNIEDYRVKYLPDKYLGLLTVMDVFDNHVLVIDEGSRNPHGLETLLTKMSISSVSEGVRIIIITDNIEPFQEVISNPRYAPLHDRTYKVMTRAIKDELTVMENLYREPVHRIDVVHLLAVQKFIESIPVPEGIMYLAKAIGNALEFKYSIVSAKPGVKHLRPIRRDERANIEIDIFTGLDFKFISGGRYTYHTIMLAKFFAFLNKHEYVTLDDFKQALLYTIKSRLVVDASTYSEYKIKVMEVLSRIDESLVDAENVIKRVVFFITLLRKNADKKSIEDEFAKLVSESNLNPILAPAVMSTLELALTIYNINIDELPDNVKYSIIELKLEKGDFTDLSKHMDAVREIIKSRRSVIRP